MTIPCAQCGEPLEKNPIWASDNFVHPWRHKGHSGVGHQGVPNPDFIMSVIRHPSTRTPVPPKTENHNKWVAAIRDRLDTRCIRWPFMLSDLKPERCGDCTGCVSAEAIEKIDENRYLDEAIQWEKTQVLRTLAENSPHRRVRMEDEIGPMLQQWRRDNAEVVEELLHGEWPDPEQCKRCLFPAIPQNDLCMGHRAVMDGKRRYGTTTERVKEEHLRGVRVVFIGFWRGDPNDFIAEMVETLDTDEPSILNLGTSEVVWEPEYSG